MKLKYLFLIFGFVTNVYANSVATPEQEQALQKKYNEYLTSQGISIPTKHVEVVPENKLRLPVELKTEIYTKMNMIQKQGYVENSNPKIKELLEIEKTSQKEKIKYKNNNNPASTHLRDKQNQVNMAYHFEPIPNEFTKNIYGFAPAGTYTKSGWTGMVELFKSAQLGNCNYEEINLNLSEINIRIPKNITSHEVNNKITTNNIQGNAQDGYLYTVEWYDENFSRKLECVANIQSKDNLQSLIAMARKIDQ